ncbi:anti-sigma factor domain-containing protein [Paraliobacillus salinarum]|uniref:anti-sigma factor domain-containing protein n=1 Tax=Paraliobacillus salinarum TaxID=1158996 RepID=UPI0015F3C06C|nr:anti-sigma factor domain-containing protein [Paraliobacillus salinarum]
MNYDKLHGIVMEVQKKQYIILTNEGDFKRVNRTKGYMPEVGEEVTISENDVVEKKQLITSVPHIIKLIAVAFLIVIVINIFSARSTEASYAIILKINPSVEVIVNRDLSVLEVNPLNQEAEQLLQTIEEEDVTLYDFSNQFIQQSITSGYLNKEGTIASVIVSLNDKNISFEQDFRNELTSRLAVESVQADIKIKQLSEDTYNTLKENPEQIYSW